MSNPVEVTVAQVYREQWPALAEHAGHLAELTAELDKLPDPLQRLKTLAALWVSQRDLAARYGCPTGTLAVELDKRTEGGIDLEAGKVIRLLLES